MSKPEDYKHIRAWGIELLSFNYYIESQQEQAVKDKAPINAIYWSVEDNRYHTADEIKDPSTKARIDKNASEL